VLELGCGSAGVVSGLPAASASGVNVVKTVTAASGTGRNIGTATCLQRGQMWPRWRDVTTCTGGCGYSFQCS